MADDYYNIESKTDKRLQTLYQKGKLLLLKQTISMETAANEEKDGMT
jgi:hypothetical protein